MARANDPETTAVHGKEWTDGLLEAPHDAPDKAGRVRRMFDAIAPRYELVNTLFSAGRDASWRRRAVRMARVAPEDAVLDVACGTGDFARAFGAVHPRLVVGCDFAHQMLLRAVARPQRATVWCEADALCLPFRSGCFDVVSCAFGVRNFARFELGLAEMFRVLRPGGRVIILEFTRPKNRWMRGLFEWYSHRVMPAVAALISGDRTGAYRYLPRSVVSFADTERLPARLHDVGFTRCAVVPLTMGVVTAYLAVRA